MTNKYFNADSKVSRRQILKLGGAALASATLASATATLAPAAFAGGFPAIIPAAVLGENAPSKRLNVALVGCGQMGGADFANIIGNKRTLARAVCDVDDARAAAAANQANRAYGNNDCLRFRDFREVTRRDDVDAVIVATPDHWHALVAIDAVRHGKDAYVEKPLTLTIAEGRVLVDAARRHQRVVQTGSQQRSSRYFRHVCELVRNGRIGKISRVEVSIPRNNRHCAATWKEEPVPAGFDYDTWLGPAPWAPFTRQRTHYQFRFILDYANGQITNFGAHDIDICQWALGFDDAGPTRFEGWGEFPSSGLFTSPTRVDVRAEYPTGTVLRVSNHFWRGTNEFENGAGGGTGDAAARRGTVRFFGENGAWLAVSRSGMWASKPALLKEKIGASEIRLYESRSHMGNFLDCVRTRRLPVADVAIGHRTASICNISMLAMQLGRPLVWDPATESFPHDPVANRLRSRAMRGPWRLL